jgi:hypothetical protein
VEVRGKERKERKGKDKPGRDGEKWVWGSRRCIFVLVKTGGVVLVSWLSLSPLCPLSLLLAVVVELVETEVVVGEAVTTRYGM